MEVNSILEDQGERALTLCPDLLKCIPAEQCQVLANILKDTPYANIFKELMNTLATTRLTSLLESIQDMEIKNKEIIVKEVKETQERIEKDIEISIKEAKEALKKLTSTLSRHKESLDKYRLVNNLVIREGLVNIDNFTKNS
jgi:hypothetical protein